MRKYRKRLAGLLFFCFGASGAFSQTCVTAVNNSVINFSCGLNCSTVNIQVPDLRTTSNYVVSTIPFSPLPFVTAGGNEITSVYVDDVYSGVINMPFGFCFYDSVFSKCVVGSNGLITFDAANASCGNSWQQTQPIFYAGGSICSAGAAYYPRASIMGIFTDLFPVAAASPPDRKIEWRVEGTAPCRKFIVSFYKVGMFGSGNYVPGGTNCNSLNPSTFQIILYESTALIEVHIERKQCIATSNPGGANAILGIQNWARDKAVAAPGKNATVWTAQNESFRFTPSGGATRFINSQLFTLSGTMVATATTANTTQGLIDLSFSNVCPSGNSEQFVVKSSYASCIDPNTTLVFEDTITINKTNSLNATAASTNINCATGATGSITVNVPVNSGVPPYQYSLNGGTPQTSNVFTGLPTGTYTVFATDVNGCNTTMNVTISRSGNLGVGTTINNVSCAGINNGSITILPPSFYTPIQYSLNGGPPQTSNVFANLSASTYSINVTDAIGCTGSTTVVVNQGAGVTASFATTPASCSGANNGTITVTPGNGTPPYQYSLNGGPYQPANVFTSLAPATYTVTVRDVNGCNSSFPVTVNPGAVLNAGVIKTDVSCNGGLNGSITINVTNGTPPYQYSLNNVTWQPGNSFTGLSAGTYTVYYRDNNACSNSQTVTINQPAAINATVNAQPVICFGQSNGQINISATGGVSPYLYSLDGINYQAGNSFSVPAGLFIVYVRDNNGCISQQPVTITQPPQLSLGLAMQNASCNGGADGQITATGSGGTGSLQYSTDGTNFQSSGIFNVTPGNYTVTVKDANNCTTTQTIIVGLTSNLSITPSSDLTICEGSSVQLNVNTNANQFLWTPAASLNDPSVQNPLASPVVTTQYIVTANFGQCSGRDTIVVNVNPAPVPDAGPDGDICFGQNFRLLGSGGVQFNWAPSTSLSSSSIFDPLSNPAQTITYNLSVVDANGCPSLIQDQVTVKVTPPIVVKTFPTDTVVFAGDQFQLLATSAGTNYLWSPSTGLSNPFIPNPIISVTTDIKLNVEATTSAGCRGDGNVYIKVYKGPEIYMPTGFTPNGDGKNDKFRPFTVGITQLNYFKVFNRWGQLLYSTTVLNEGWDGRVGGVDQPVGTFVWMVQGVARDGRLITKKGTVTLIR